MLFFIIFSYFLFFFVIFYYYFSLFFIIFHYFLFLLGDEDLRGMFHEAYSAIEENSSTDGWHFEVDMTLGGNALATPYISSLGTYVKNDNILKLFIELFDKIFKF